MSKKIHEIDAAELELRVLAHMREDAENIDDTDSFKRSDDFHRVNAGELKHLFPLKEAKNILKEGVVNPVEIRKNLTAELLGIPIADVTDADMRFAKVYIFADMYGADPRALKKLIRNDLEKAQQRLNKS